MQWKLLAVECSNKPGWEIGGLTPDGDGSSSCGTHSTQAGTQHFSCRGEGAPGGRRPPPRPWTIAHTQLLFLLYTTHKHSPLNRSLHRHQSHINHVATAYRHTRCKLTSAVVLHRRPLPGKNTRTSYGDRSNSFTEAAGDYTDRPIDCRVPL